MLYNVADWVIAEYEFVGVWIADVDETRLGNAIVYAWSVMQSVFLHRLKSFLVQCTCDTGN